MSEKKEKYDRRTILQVKWDLAKALFDELMATDVSKPVAWMEGYKAAMNVGNKVVEKILRHSE